MKVSIPWLLTECEVRWNLEYNFGSCFCLICQKLDVANNYLENNQELQIVLKYIDYILTYQSLLHYICDIIHHFLSFEKDCQKSSGISSDF